MPSAAAVIRPLRVITAADLRTDDRVLCTYTGKFERILGLTWIPAGLTVACVLVQLPYGMRVMVPVDTPCTVIRREVRAC